MNTAQIKRSPGDARAEIPGVCAVLAQASERFRLKTDAPDERDTRKQVRRRDADECRRSRQRALRGANVRAAAQQSPRIAKRDTRYDCRQRFGDREFRFKSGGL